VASLENLTLPGELANRISEKSNRNLRRALLILQTCATQKYPFTHDQLIAEPDWEVYLRETARIIAEQQSSQRILEVRERLYELIAHCIPAEIIFKGLLDELLKTCDGQLKIQITQIAAEYEHRLRQGSKDLFHLEAFIAKFMLVYKRFIDSTADDLLKSQITQIAAEYEHRLRQGSKEIFHLEAFVAKFMCIYKQHMQSMAAGLDDCFD